MENFLKVCRLIEMFRCSHTVLIIFGLLAGVVCDDVVVLHFLDSVSRVRQPFLCLI